MRMGVAGLGRAQGLKLKTGRIEGGGQFGVPIEV